MIKFDEAVAHKLVVHKVTDDINTCVTAQQTTMINDDDENDIIKNIFGKPFNKALITHEFTHEVSKDLNVLNKLSPSLFNEEQFFDTSINILKHLVDVSKHHNINEGELVIIHFDNIIFENKTYEAVGIYKIEDRTNFVTTDENDKANLSFKKGINHSVINKAGLILNTPDDFTILIFNNKDAAYWSEDFFNVKSKDDDINLTNTYLKMTKHFIAKSMPNEYEVSRTEQIDLLNKSIEYFKDNEQFVEDEFVNNVFEDKSVIDSFAAFKTEYGEKAEEPIGKSFDIAPQIVKKQARTFKSVLKLDKNFHIYIHGNRDLIEQGIDERGRRFYKIYYEEES